MLKTASTPEKATLAAAHTDIHGCDDAAELVTIELLVMVFIEELELDCEKKEVGSVSKHHEWRARRH